MNPTITRTEIEILAVLAFFIFDFIKSPPTQIEFRLCGEL
jgi:hypothetical protein